MNIYEFSVKRPIAIIVFITLITLFGFLNLKKMPISEYPNIDIPIISISTQYVGASSNIIETKITQKIENAISGIEGLESIQSSSKEGKSSIKLEFSINRNIEDAANDVRDRLNKVMKSLPKEATNPVISKHDSTETPSIMIAITSSKMSPMQISDYIDRYIIDRFSVIEGVAAVNIIGRYEQSMRIWLNAKSMAARGITAPEIEKAIKSENTEYPAGRIESLEKEFSLSIDKPYNSVNDFKKLIIARDNDGNQIKLSDISRIAVEPRTNRNLFKANYEDVICLTISKQAKANSLSISTKTKEIIKQLAPTLPNDMKITILTDESIFIKNSIMEVIITLLISSILVFFIIFVFIGSFRAALIPTCTVPISIIGSCIVLNAMGYSINMLSLLGIVLAIGIVVDDSILVLENTKRLIDEGETPFNAAINGTKQVFFAVISTTVVLLSVFIPISLLPGKTGKLFTEFSMAISVSVCLSSILALTLTPMLCSQFLNKEKQIKFADTVNLIFQKMQHQYESILQKSYANLRKIIICFIALISVTLWILHQLPGEFEPKEDRNSITLKIKAPEGTGYYSMSSRLNTALKQVYPLLEENVAKNILGTIPGFGESLDGAINSGVVMIDLIDSKKRSISAFDIATKYKKLFKKIPTVDISPVLPHGIGSKGSQALKFVISGHNYAELSSWKDIILSEIAKNQIIIDTDCDYKETTPKLHIKIDKDKAGALGIDTNIIGSTLFLMLGSKKVTSFIDRGQEYDVIIQADSSSRNNIADIKNLYVKSKTLNKLINLDNIITIQEKGEPSKLGRHNRSRSITIQGNLAKGYSISDAVHSLQNIQKEKLPEHAKISFLGQAKDFLDSSDGSLFIFVLAVIISYLILAAQFENFLSPLIVMLTVPLGIFGAAITMYMVNMSSNIYTQIGMIMLIGLNAKHGIMIVEFANQLRTTGISIKESVFSAAKMRLRPIIMTGISTIIGSLPLLFASGASSASRHSLGIVEVFGGLTGILFTLIIIPMGYLYYFNKQTTFQKDIEK